MNSNVHRAKPEKQVNNLCEGLRRRQESIVNGKTNSYLCRPLRRRGRRRVKAELVSVGESGERSLRKIESAGGRASRGLAHLTDRAGSLRIGIRALGGALAGVATVGGLKVLIDRSISAADAVGKTADKIGVGVEALQELRYAAQLAGVEQRTMDMALQRFTRRVAEAAKGTGEAKQALAQMGIALKDQHGNIRRSEDLLNDVAEAFKRTRDPAERLRLAFKLFDSEGVAMVNMLVGGAEALEATRRRARDLGIVLDEDLVRNAEKARDELDTLGKVISANLIRAVLDLAPAIADASSELAELASRAGIAYEELKLLAQGDFNFEGLSLRSTKAIVEDLRDDVRALRAERDALGEGILDDLRRRYVEWQLSRKERALQQWQAKLAWMQRDTGNKAQPGADAGTTSDSIEADVKAAQDRARRIARIERDLQRQLFEATHEGADRIRAEYDRLVAEMQTLIAPDGSNLEKVGEIMRRAAAVRDAKLARLVRQEEEAARRRADANRRIIESLKAERDALAMTDRERFIGQALRRLSAEATEEQRRQVRELAGALYDEQQAQEAARAARKAEEDRQKLLGKGRALRQQLRTADEAYKAELEELNQLLRAGAIDQETYARATEDAYDRMLQASREWSAGVQRALREYGRQAGDAARQFEEVTASALKASEDAWVNWARTGKLSVTDFFATLEEAALRAAYRLLVFKPMESFLEGLLGGLKLDLFGGSSGGTTAPPILDAPAFGSGGYAVAHTGGVVGGTPLPRRSVDPAVFEGAPRLHGGGLVPGEVPVIARRGEVIGWPEQMRRAFGSDVVVQVIDQRSGGARPEVSSERGPDGRRIVRVLIRDEVNRGIAQGAFDQALSGAYGLSRRGVPR